MPLSVQSRHQIFLSLTFIVFIAACVLVGYLVFSLLQPHLSTILWSISFAIALQPLKRFVFLIASFIGDGLSLRVKLVASSFVLLCIAFALGRGLPLPLFVVASVFVIMILFPFFVDRSTLAATVVVSVFVGIALIVLLIFSKTFYDETLVVSTEIRDFLEYNKETFQNSTKLANMAISTCNQASEWTPLRWLGSPRVRLWCIHGLESFTENAPLLTDKVLTVARDNVGVMANYFKDMADWLRTVPFSLAIFFSVLFYLLQNDRMMFAQLLLLSPLEVKDTEDLYNNLYEKIGKALLLLTSSAICTFWTTFLGFYVAQTNVIWFFCFVSSIPVLSGWAVWLPGTLYVIIRDGLFTIRWMVMLGMFIAGYYSTQKVQSFIGIEQQSPFLIGLALFFGAYQYGVSGILVGPVIAGVALLLIGIYKKEVQPLSNDELRREAVRSLISETDTPLSKVAPGSDTISTKPTSAIAPHTASATEREDEKQEEKTTPPSLQGAQSVVSASTPNLQSLRTLLTTPFSISSLASESMSMNASSTIAAGTDMLNSPAFLPQPTSSSGVLVSSSAPSSSPNTSPSASPSQEHASMAKSQQPAASSPQSSNNNAPTQVQSPNTHTVHRTNNDTRSPSSSSSDREKPSLLNMFSPRRVNNIG